MQPEVPLPQPARPCTACQYHLMKDFKYILCNHPERPDAPAVVARWYFGCPQFTPSKESPACASPSNSHQP